ncbi:MAG: WD40 repeat domain-containing serine/threonine-protein kinase, partial [Chloroflexota bacterium]
MPLQDGDLLNDRYRIEGILGQGGFGAVYRAMDEELGLRCAVKENLNLSFGSEKQFRREARLLATLRHPNLPRVTNHFVIGREQYLVMDFVEGEDSSRRLEREGPLAESEVVRWIEQVCSALNYLHGLEAPVIHRDVKPANIKITPEGQAILVDFGLAKDWSAGQTTSTGAKGITPGFAPPEQYDLGHTDARTDVYALGATLYNLLTGQNPPDSVDRLIGMAALIPPRQLRPGLSPHVDSATLRAMEVKAESRFQSAGEFAAALGEPTYRYQPLVETVTIGEEERAVERAPSFQPEEWARRAIAATRRALPSVLGAAGLLAALAVVFVGPATLLQGARDLAGLPERPLVASQVEATVQPASFARLVATPVPPATPTLNVAVPTAIVLPTPTPLPVAATSDNAASWRLSASWRAGEGTVPFVMSPGGDSLMLVDRQGVDTFELSSGTRQDELQGFLVGRKVYELAHLGNSVLVQFADEILQYDLSSKNLIQSFRVAGRDMRVSPDGRLLAVREKYISLLSLESGKLVATLGEEGSTQEYSFSPDGQLFALTRRNSVEFYDTRTGRLLRTLAGHGEPTGALTFTPDGGRLVSASGDVWDVAIGELVTVFDSSTSLVTVSPNGQLVVGDDGSVWDLTTGELLGAIPVQSEGVRRMQFTPDGQFLVRQARDGRVELWTVDPNAALALAVGELEPPAMLPIGEVITPLNVSRLAPLSRLAEAVPGRFVISPGWTTAATWSNSTVIIFSLVSGEELQQLRISGEILDVAYLGEEFLTVINAFRQVERWEVGTGRLKQTYDYLGHRVEASAEGSAFAVQEKYIQVIDMVTGRRLHNLGSAVAIEQLYPELLGTGADLTDLGQDFVFAPDGKHLAIAFGSGVSLWDIQTGRAVQQFSGHGPPTRGLSFTPDGARLVSASGDVWEVGTGERITEFEVQADAVAISPSGNLIAGADGSLWDGNTGQYLGSLGVEALALWFTPNDRQLIVHTKDGGVLAYAIKPKVAHTVPPSSAAAGADLAELGRGSAPRLALVGWWG